MIDIEERLELDERSAVDFVLTMRKRWSDTVYPSLAEQYRHSGPPSEDIEEAGRRLRGLELYPWYSHLERVQQKMLWKIAGDAVLRRRADLLAQFGQDRPTLGRLELNPDLELPSWYTDHDIHIQPGSFFSDDMSAYVYEFGARIVMLRDNDGYKFHRLFAETALPPHHPGVTRVVDIGCGFGKSTRPLARHHPGAEIIGVDLAAPGLRLAHAEAEADGLAITYRQADGRATGLEGGTCDLVTGTMVLHEMPAGAVNETIREAARLLKPGGALRFLEFDLTGDPFRDATIVEHAERNNEPFFHDLFGADLPAMCREAGLAGARWTPFDERRDGLSPNGWGERPEWHFPWAVLSATKPE